MRKQDAASGPELTVFELSFLLAHPPEAYDLPLKFALGAAGIATQTFTDFVVGHGEIWSADLFAATCRKVGGDAVWLDTRDVLVVSATEVSQ